MSSLRVPHALTSAGVARRRLTTELVARGLPSALVDDVALVVSELVGNAVRHGSPLPDGSVLVLWELDGSVLRLEVCDGGDGPADLASGAGDRPQPPTGAEGGRGLAIVSTVAARWGSTVRDGATCVSAELLVAEQGREYARA